MTVPEPLAELTVVGGDHDRVDAEAFGALIPNEIATSAVASTAAIAMRKRLIDEAMGTSVPSKSAVRRFRPAYMT